MLEIQISTLNWTQEGVVSWGSVLVMILEGCSPSTIGMVELLMLQGKTLQDM